MKPVHGCLISKTLPLALFVAALFVMLPVSHVAAQSCRNGLCGSGDIEGDARVEVHVTVTLDPSDGGLVLVNDLELQGGVFSTLQGETLVLEAVPNHGYVFDHWSDWFDESASVIEAPIYNHKTLTAHFAPESPRSDNEQPSNDIASSSIPQGTSALDRHGNALATYSVELRLPRALPSSGVLLGDVYSYRPEGATFDPPLHIALPYRPEELPAGVVEAELAIAMFDADLQDWVPLKSVVVPERGTVETDIGHFSEFAVVAPLPASTELLITPGFSFSSLAVTPPTAYPGQDVTVNVIATYVGANARAKSHVFVAMDGKVADETVVSLSPGDAVLIRFTVRPEQEGAHLIDVSGLTQTITVNGSASALAQAIELSAHDRFAPMDAGTPSLLSRLRPAAYLCLGIVAALIVAPLMSALRRKWLRFKYDL